MALSLSRSFISTCNFLRIPTLKISNCYQVSLGNSFHSMMKSMLKLPTTTQSHDTALPSNCWSLTSVRTNIRDNWPRPSEKKRQKFNYWNRMKTRGGRAIIMRRYLKGRHVLSH